MTTSATTPDTSSGVSNSPSPGGDDRADRSVPLRARQDDPASIIAPEGVPIIVAFVLVSVAIVTAAGWWLGPVAASAASAVTCLLCLWAIWFFRDPQRRIPERTDGVALVICPADGVISFVGPARPPGELGMSEAESAATTRVSVFMNVFNVHVNRAPVQGVVDRTVYTPGKFFNAALDKASEHNERMGIILKTAGGRRIACVQIAGLIARRIVCRVGEGAALKAGQRFGLIRFGSRVDVYLPRGVVPLVKVGDRTVAGETIFAVLDGPPESPRTSRPHAGEV